MTTPMGSPVAEEDGVRLPPFHVRVGQVFFSPGRLSEALAVHPSWFAVLVLGAVLLALQSWLIPIEVWEAMFREMMIQQGRPVPEGMAGPGVGFMRISAVVFGPLMFAVIAFLLAGVATVIFAFVLGDDGRYRQYLAVICHAWIIPTFVGLLLVPLRIAEQNPQLTLNLGTFLYFLPEGYVLKVMTMLDLTQLWAWAVVGWGAHAIDSRRSVGSAVAILVGLNLVLVMIFANFVPTL